MRGNESFSKWMGSVLLLGTALVAGCGGVEAEPARTGSLGSALDEGLPELVVSALEAPTVVPEGSIVAPRVKVCNQGTVPAEGRMRLFVSPTPEVSTGGGMELGETNVGMLAPGQCVTREQPAMLPLGDHYLVAVAGADSTRARRISVGWRAELVVTALEAPHHVRPGEELQARVTVCNRGTSPAQASAGLYLSTDESISVADPFLVHTQPVWLEGGGCVTQDLQAWSFVPEGTYFLGAVADPMGQQDEADEENNALNRGRFGVGYGPDLVISEVRGPVSTEGFTPFTSTVTVCNQGTVGAEGAFRLFLSPDPELSPTEEVPGGGIVGFLSPGQCASQEVQVQASVWNEGAWYLGASVESLAPERELLESNNTRVSEPVGVGGMPDFIVSALAVPPSVQPGTSFSTSVTVCNQGTRPSDADVELFLVSAPDEGPIDAPSLGGFFLGNLEAGQCVTQEVSAHLGYLGAGPFHVRASVDRGGTRQELIESNNSRTSDALTITY